MHNLLRPICGAGAGSVGIYTTPASFLPRHSHLGMRLLHQGGGAGGALSGTGCTLCCLQGCLIYVYMHSPSPLFLVLSPAPSSPSFSSLSPSPPPHLPFSPHTQSRKLCQRDSGPPCCCDAWAHPEGQEQTFSGHVVSCQWTWQFSPWSSTVLLVGQHLIHMSFWCWNEICQGLLYYLLRFTAGAT